MMEFLFAKCGAKAQKYLDESIIVEVNIFDESCRRSSSYIHSSKLSCGSRHDLDYESKITKSNIPSQRSIIQNLDTCSQTSRILQFQSQKSVESVICQDEECQTQDTGYQWYKHQSKGRIELQQPQSNTIRTVQNMGGQKLSTVMNFLSNKK